MVPCIISCLPQSSPQCWWLQLWWKGHTPSSWSPPTPLSNSALSAPHIAHLYILTSIDLTKWLCVSVFMCYTLNVYFPNVGLHLKKHIWLIQARSCAFHHYLPPSMTLVSTHTIGSMPSQLEQCVRHALILLLCQFYKYGAFRISPVLKPTEYIECIHWIQQHRCVSICEPMKSALRHHNLIQKPASASLSSYTSVNI